MRRMKQRDYEGIAFPLRRTVLCAACGRPYTASAPRGRRKRYAYYHCASKKCTAYGKSHPQAVVESRFAQLLLHIRPRVKRIVAVIAGIVDCSKRMRLEEHAKRVRLEERITDLQTQRDRIFEMREDGSYTKEQFLERQRANDDKLDAVHVERGILKEYSSNVGTLIYDGLNFIRDLMASWKTLSPQLQRRFQRVIFPAGISYDRIRGFGTAKLGALFELSEGILDPTSLLVPLDGTGWNQIIDDLKELKAIHDEWKSGEVPKVPTSLDPPDDWFMAA